MERNLAKLLLFIVIGTSTILTSCKKSETAPEVLPEPKLVKVASWNPSTNVESTNIELTYDANGKITTVMSGGTSYLATYNSNNKLSLLSGVIKGGVTVTFALEYNTSSQLIKITHTNVTGTSDNSYVKTMAYNTAGKVSKITIVYANTAVAPYVVDYTWNGDNIASSVTGNYTTTYTTYDDKLNPYSLGEGIAVIYYGGPPSKNNFTEIKTLNGALINTQKRSYEYNAAGYATSMKLMDGSNEGQKYYYLP